jgi:hypothetical protein
MMGMNRSGSPKEAGFLSRRRPLIESRRISSSYDYSNIQRPANVR